MIQTLYRSRLIADRQDTLSCLGCKSLFCTDRKHDVGLLSLDHTVRKFLNFTFKLLKYDRIGYSNLDQVFAHPVILKDINYVPNVGEIGVRNRCQKDTNLAEIMFSRVRVLSCVDNFSRILADNPLFDYNCSATLGVLCSVGMDSLSILLLVGVYLSKRVFGSDLMIEVLDGMRIYNQILNYTIPFETKVALRQYKSIFGFMSKNDQELVNQLVRERGYGEKNNMVSDRGPSVFLNTEVWHAYQFACTVRRLSTVDISNAMFVDQSFKDFKELLPLWVTSGASSNKSEGRTKKVRAVTQDHSIVSDTIPTTMLVNPSIKKEAGNKARLILAEDDNSYLHCAYYLGGFEYSLNIEGAVMRQKPGDVAEWLKNCDRKRAGSYLLCADYKDFNAQHSIMSRQILHLLLSFKLYRAGYKMKALSGFGLVCRLNNTYVKGTTKIRSNFGLNSGERCTTFDNTMLHRIYADMAILCSGQTPLFFRACGDDEVCIFDSKSAALGYYKALVDLGFGLQQYKQLLSQDEAEFLQVTYYKGRGYQPIITPVQRMLYTFVNATSGKKLWVVPDIIRDHITRFIRIQGKNIDLNALLSITASLLRDKNNNCVFPDKDAIVPTHNKDYEGRVIKYRCNRWGREINNRVNEHVQKYRYIDKNELVEVSESACIDRLRSLVSESYNIRGYTRGFPLYWKYLNDVEDTSKDLKTVLSIIGIPVQVNSIDELRMYYTELSSSERNKINWHGINKYSSTNIELSSYKGLLPGQLAALVI